MPSSMPPNWFLAFPLPAAAGWHNAAAGAPAGLPHITLLRPRRAEAEQWREPMARWMEQAPLPAAGADLAHLALYTWAADRRERLFQPVRQRLLIAE